MQDAAAHMFVKLLSVPTEDCEIFRGVEEETKGSFASPVAALPTLPERFQRFNHEARHSHHGETMSAFRAGWAKISLREPPANSVSDGDTVGRVPVACMDICRYGEDGSEFGVGSIVVHSLQSSQSATLVVVDLDSRRRTVCERTPRTAAHDMP
jgi:hypothetical protein